MEKEAAEEEEEDESEEEDDESDSESEDVAHAPLSSGRRPSGGVAIPGLTPNQIKKLLDLATKSDAATTSSSIDKLQKQISQLMADKKNGVTRERGSSGASLKEIKALQQKLTELEKKTQSVAYAPQSGGMTMARSVYTPLLVKDDPDFTKYFKLKSMNMPIDQIKTKMKSDGVSPDLLDTPDAVSPNDSGPEKGAYIPMTVANDPAFKKYFKLKDMSMPEDQIKMKMEAEGVDPRLLDTPNSVSPNDPGPPVQAPTSPTGPVSMEQLFSILMQHQQIIQQVSNGGSLSGSRGRGSSGGVDGMPPRSVEDQMAQELAAAESAIDDIFGDESQQSKGPGGMSMIEQLEKKARKESNKKLVENRDEVNRLVAELLTTKLSTDEEAISFYKTIAPKLEEYGLSLGTDSVQTWSSRLLIKNKETRDWYFSEQERLDAGKAYGRLWGLSFLERDSGQLIAKRVQILNAPATLRAIAKGKPELIDKFTQLLKDTVKLKHKVFKSGSYAAEVRQLHAFNIPERFEQRGTELIDSATVLADASMDLAEEEFKSLENTTRAKKIRARAVVHVAEKAVTLVGIVKKIGANGVNELRLREVEANVAKIKEMYLSGEQEEEEEDDVL
ncbi:WASH complex subunit CCDC53 [Phytophthora nicotianae]|uniref:WASH complex subunit CCDC53 n=1 Tax=Phytophthora nicotianae TaxID=4792 RepID=A0A0W8D125_PHYNI|nr:WASH complex subunit CCDC53 [Phytophthora nicotianae]KUF90065.1 WASH complex subunit CCDC53 [Phytophthora nicotianae]